MDTTAGATTAAATTAADVTSESIDCGELQLFHAPNFTTVDVEPTLTIQNNLHDVIYAFRIPANGQPRTAPGGVRAETSETIDMNTTGLWFFTDPRLVIRPINGSMCYIVIDSASAVTISIN